MCCRAVLWQYIPTWPHMETCGVFPSTLLHNIILPVQLTAPSNSTETSRSFHSCWTVLLSCFASNLSHLLQKVLSSMLFNVSNKSWNSEHSLASGSQICSVHSEHEYTGLKVNSNTFGADCTLSVFFKNSENVATARPALSDPDIEEINLTSVSPRLAGCHSLLSVLSQPAVSQEHGVSADSCCSGPGPPQVSCHLCYGLFALTHRVELRYSSTNQICHGEALSSIRQ